MELGTFRWIVPVSRAPSKIAVTRSSAVSKTSVQVSLSIGRPASLSHNHNGSHPSSVLMNIDVADGPNPDVVMMMPGVVVSELHTGGSSPSSGPVTSIVQAHPYTCPTSGHARPPRGRLVAM